MDEFDFLKFQHETEQKLALHEQRIELLRKTHNELANVVSDRLDAVKEKLDIMVMATALLMKLNDPTIDKDRSNKDGDDDSFKEEVSSSREATQERSNT